MLLVCDVVLVRVWMYEVLCLLVYHQRQYGIGDSGVGGCGGLVSGLGGGVVPPLGPGSGFFPLLCNPQAASPAVRGRSFRPRTFAKLHSRCCGRMDEETRKDREQHRSQGEWLDGCPRIKVQLIEVRRS